MFEYAMQPSYMNTGSAKINSQADVQYIKSYIINTNKNYWKKSTK